MRQVIEINSRNYYENREWQIEKKTKLYKMEGLKIIYNLIVYWKM